MFPDPNDRPVCHSQFRIVPVIPLDITQQFSLPPRTVPFGQRAMPGTVVPEAPVNKHGYPWRYERKIGTGLRNPR